MRVKVDFEIDGDTLPLDYRRKFLSYLKSAMQDYNAELFEALYGGGTAPKSFCSSIYFFPKVIIGKDEIKLSSNRFAVRITTPDILLGVHLTNALMGRHNKWFSLADCNNKIKAVSIAKMRERPIVDNEVQFKILSPIIIRDHDKQSGRDWYLTFEDAGFEEVWKRNLKTETQHIFNRDVSGDVDALQIKHSQLKKTVVKNYGIYIPCTIGTLRLEGEKYLLEYLYKAGIGSRRSMSFGYVEII